VTQDKYIGNKQSCVLYRQCLFFKVNSEMRNKVLKINASNIVDLYLIYHFLIKQFFQDFSAFTFARSNFSNLWLYSVLWSRKQRNVA